MANISDVQLRIAAIVDGVVEVRKLVNELDDLGGKSSESSAEVDRLTADLDKLRQQDALINKFQETKKSTAELASSMEEVRSKATALGKGLSITTKELESAKAEYSANQRATNALKKEWEEAAAKARLLGASVKGNKEATVEQKEAFAQAQEQARQLRLQYNSAKKESDDLNASTKSLSSQLKQQTKDFTDARNEVNKLDDKYIKQSATLNSLRSNLQAAGLNTKQLSSAQSQLHGSIGQVEGEISSLSVKLKNQIVDLKNASENAGNFSGKIGSLTSNLIAMAGAYIGIGKLKDGIVSLLEAGDKAEQLSIQMTAVMGSIERGQDATAWIKKFAKDTPLQLNEVTETFIRLKSMGLDPMDGTMQAVVDQSSKLGIGFEGLQGVTLALGQAWAKGKLQAEEMNQMVERGVPVMSLLSQATGKTSGELSSMAQNGLLGRDAIRALIIEMGNQSIGAANAQMGTMSGLLSNLADSWTDFKMSVANSGALEWAKNQLKELSETINQMAADGRLKQYAKNVSDWLVETGESAKRFVLDIGGSFDGLISATTITFQSLRVVFNLFTITVKAMPLALIPVVKALSLILNGLSEVANALGMEDVAARFKFSVGAMNNTLDAFVKSIDEDIKDINDATDKMASANTKSSDVVVASLKKSQVAAEETSTKIKDSLSSVGTSAEKFSSDIHEAFAKAGLDYEQSSGKVGTAVAAYVSGLDKISSSANQNGNAIKAYLEKAFDSAKNKAEIDVLLQKLEQLHAQGAIAGDPYIQSLSKATDAAKSLSSETANGTKVYIDLLNKQKQAADEAYKTGAISADAHRQKVGELNKEIEKTTIAQRENTIASNALSSAYNDLGIQSAAALDLLAKKQKSAFEEIQRSGASMDVQRQAFLAYAEAELKAAQANDRYADGALSAQAAGLGLSEQFKALEQTTANVGNQALITAGALDTLAASEKNTGDATDKASEKTKEMAGAWEGAAAASQFLTDYTNNLTTSLQKLSPAAAQMMDQMMGWTNATTGAGAAIDEINQKLAQNAREMKESMDSIATNDIQEYIDKMNQAYLAAERAYLKQAKAAEQMIDSLSSSKNITDQMVNSAESAYGSLNMLDSQTLSRLRAAIDSAKQKMESLESAAKSTLNSLQDELDQYNNNLDAIEQRRYENQIEDLKAKLKEAQAAGNGDAAAQYKEALQLAEELHQKKMADIEAEKKAAATTSASTTTNVNTSTTTTSTVSIPTPNHSQPTEVIELRIGGSSATVSADPNNAASLKDMLRTLQQHAMRS